MFQDGSLVSWLREPSDPRVRELNVALEKAREDAQYWHDLAKIATEDTDKIKDRYESLQKDSDSYRAAAEKVRDSDRNLQCRGTHSAPSLFHHRVRQRRSRSVTRSSALRMPRPSSRCMKTVWSVRRPNC